MRGRRPSQPTDSPRRSLSLIHISEPPAQLLVRKRSVPTARHSNILSAISERRAQREARVRAFLDEKRSS